MLSKSFSYTALALATAVLSLPAAAGTFEVKGVDVTAGEAELGSNSSGFWGYPSNADRLRYSSEYGLAYSLSDFWKFGLKVNLDKPVGGDVEPVSMGAELLTVFKRYNGGWGLGWYSSADIALQAGNPDTITSGPILQFGNDKTTLTLNPFFVSNFLPASRSTDFAYGWQVKHEVRDGFAVGVEGYGYIANVWDSRGTDFQEHRIGPVIYYERALKRDPRGIAPVKSGLKDGASAGGGEGPKWQMEAGVFFGLTDATQDIAVKFKSGIVY